MMDTSIQSPCNPPMNVEMSEAAEKFIQMIADKLQPGEVGEEPYYLEVGILTDGSIIAVFTPL